MEQVLPLHFQNVDHFLNKNNKSSALGKKYDSLDKIRNFWTEISQFH